MSLRMQSNLTNLRNDHGMKGVHLQQQQSKQKSDYNHNAESDFKIISAIKANSDLIVNGISELKSIIAANDDKASRRAKESAQSTPIDRPSKQLNANPHHPHSDDKDEHDSWSSQFQFLQTSSHDIQAKVDTILSRLEKINLDGVITRLTKVEQTLERVKIVVTGQENVDGLRAYYQRSAFDKVVQLMHNSKNTAAKRSVRTRSTQVTASGNTTSNDDGHKHGFRLKTQRRKLQSLHSEDSVKTSRTIVTNTAVVGDHVSSPLLSDEPTEFLLVLPTFKRISLQDNTEYLRRVLVSLVKQYNALHLTASVVQVLVVNNSPTVHGGVVEAVNDILTELHSSLKVLVTNGSAFEQDPFPEEYKVKLDLPHKSDVLESWVPSRKHTSHLVEVMFEALKVSSKYVLLWEDDMLFCSQENDPRNGTLQTIIDFTHKANSVTTTWTGLRLGFGGNGLILHWSDLPIISDYLLANTHRKPPDWLLTEWYKGLTYSARMAIGDRHHGFTYHLNMFEHIGHHSSFPDREGQGSNKSTSHVNYEIPKCFEHNWFLLPAERPDKVRCKDVGVTPCDHPFHTL